MRSPPRWADEVTRLLAWRVEEACLNAWPALRSVLWSGWLLQFGEGLSRRANSISPLRPDAALVAGDLEHFAGIYRAQGLPLIVRVVSLLDSSIERELDRRGFAAEGETCTLFGELSGARPVDPDAEVHSELGAEWLAAMSRLQNHSPAQSAIYRRVIERIVLPVGFAALRRDGEIAAVAYGAIHDGLLCCESVIVSDHRRGQGCGTRLMTALFGWAANNGARAACLQVVAANTAGRALYRRVGLDTELHRYHYRRAPSPAR